jgi:hypothetical protein
MTSAVIFFPGGGGGGGIYVLLNQCFGSMIIFFGSGSDLTSNFGSGSGLFLQHAFL